MSASVPTEPSRDESVDSNAPNVTPVHSDEATPPKRRLKKPKKPWWKIEIREIDKRRYEPISCLVFKISNPFRQYMIRWAESSFFGFIILFTIFLNTIMLAIADPLDLPELQPQSQARDIIELLGMVFNIVFFVEAFSKIVALGFYGGKSAYLSSAWNIMDFFIVVMSVFDFIPGMSGGNFSAIRSFRVLRPLRTITKFPELRFLVSLLLSCIPMLANVFGLNFFIYFVFGILGMQLFGGALRGRCYSLTDGAVMEDPFAWEYICGEGALPCPTGYTCMKLGDNPYHGMVTLDDIYHALIVIFQIMTQEGWVDVMYPFQDSVSFFAFIYFFVLIFVGPIFAIQLFLVVITNKFNESKQAQELAASVSVTKTPEKPKKPLSQIIKKHLRSLLRSIKRAIRRKKVHAVGDGHHHHHHHHRKTESPSVFARCAALPPMAAVLRGLSWVRSKLLIVAEGKLLGNIIVGCIMVNTFLMAIDHACDFKELSYCYTFKGSLEAFNVAFCFIFFAEMVIKTGGFGLARYFSDVYNIFDFFIVVISLVEIYSVTTTAICLLSATDGDQATLCDSGGSGLSVLRTFRLLRLIKLLKSFPNLQSQLAVAGKTLGSTSWLFLLVVIFLVIFTILGMSQFAGAIIDDPEALIMGSSVLVYWNEDITSGPTRLWPGIVTNISIDSFPYRYHVTYKFPLVGRNNSIGEWMYCPTLCPADKDDICGSVPFIRGAVPRGNWDNFFVGFITTFQMVTQDSWNNAMYASTRYSSALAAVYFILLIIIGNFILFNLLIAIIIQGFADTKAQKESAQQSPGQAADHESTAGSPVSSPRDPSRMVSTDSPQSSPTKPTPKVVLWISHTMSAARDGFYSLPPVAAIVAFNSDRVEHAFWVIPPESVSRRFCAAIATNSLFETIILIAILLSSAQLAVSRPAMGADEADFFENMGLFMNALFLLEAVLKVISLGGMQYLSTGWNKLDGFIVTVSVIDTVLTYAAGGGANLSMLRILRIFRIFRALRPLRIVSRAKGVRIVITTLLSAAGPMMNTVSIAVGVFTVFGILAVQLFGGNSHYCSDIAVFERRNCVGVSPVDGNVREWKNAERNFDNIGIALYTMFTLAAGDNWGSTMWTAVDTKSAETGPYENNQLFLALFFVVFLLVGGFFVINIFVGVFVDVYNQSTTKVKQEMEEETKAANELAAQEAAAAKAIIDGWIADREAERASAGHGISMCARNAIRRSVMTISFDLFIAACIVLNIVSMSIESYKNSFWQLRFLFYSNIIFTLIFGFEAFLKIWALYPRVYFNDGWSKFDFTIVMISFAGLVLDSAGLAIPINPTIFRVLRVFRIFRILRAFRIFKAAKGLQQLVSAMSTALPAIANLGAVQSLLAFIFGILAVSFFGSICADNDLDLDGDGVRCFLVDPSNLLDRHSTFKNLGLAMILLFRVMTNDNWGAVQIATSREPDVRSPMGLPAVSALLNTPGCRMGANSTTQTCAFKVMQQLLPGCVDDRELMLLGVKCPTADGACNSTCGSRVVSSVYFAVFLMIATFILLNIVIAVLMQQMTDVEIDTEMYISGALKRNSMHRIMWRIRRNARAIVHTQLAKDGLIPADLLHREIEFIPPNVAKNDADAVQAVSPIQLMNLFENAEDFEAKDLRQERRAQPLQLPNVADSLDVSEMD